MGASGHFLIAPLRGLTSSRWALRLGLRAPLRSSRLARRVDFRGWNALPFGSLVDGKADDRSALPGELNKELVGRALAGDASAVRALVTALTPVIHARVARALLRRRGLSRGRDVRQLVEDVAQDIFVELFRADGKALRAWDPARGMGLRGYVGLIAEQQTAAVLRSRKRSPWTEDPTLSEALDGPSSNRDSPEAKVASRQSGQRLLDRMRAELSPLGLSLFQRLIVQQEPVASVCAQTGMTVDAVHAWSSRLKRLLVRLASQMETDDPEPSSERAAP